MAIEKRPIKYHYYAVSPCVLSFLDSGNLRLNAGTPFSLTPPQAELANNPNHPKKTKFRLVDVDYEEVEVPDVVPKQKPQPPDMNLPGSKKEPPKQEKKPAGASTKKPADSDSKKDKEKDEAPADPYLMAVAGAQSVNALVSVLNDVLQDEKMTDQIREASIAKYPSSSRLKNFFSGMEKKK